MLLPRFVSDGFWYSMSNSEINILYSSASFCSRPDTTDRLDIGWRDIYCWNIHPERWLDFGLHSSGTTALWSVIRLSQMGVHISTELEM